VSPISRIHGRNGLVYLGVGGVGTANGTASQMAYLSDWTVNFTVAKVDVTAMGDPNLIWVAGLPDASGDFTGFMDTATAQTYQAAVDGLPRNFYLYMSATTYATYPQYIYGTILPDFAISGGVASAVTLKSTWNAASTISRYPSTGQPGS
jgi:hypothetical protein